MGQSSRAGGRRQGASRVWGAGGGTCWPPEGAAQPQQTVAQRRLLRAVHQRSSVTRSCQPGSGSRCALCCSLAAVGYTLTQRTST